MTDPVFDASHKPKKSDGAAAPASAKARPEPAAVPADRVRIQLLSAGPAPAAAGAAAAGDAGPPGSSLPPTFGVVVDDDAPAGAGQVGRTEFLDALGAEIERVADQELAPTGRTARDCPYIGQWLRYYRGRPAAQLERAIQQYAHPDRTDPAGLREAVLARLRTGIHAWVRSGGRDVQVPPGVEWSPPTAGAAPAAAEGGLSGPALLAEGGGPPAGAPSSPAAIGARLSAGVPLEAGTRGRMEAAFGASFSQVRVHADPQDSAVAGALGARAFALGPHVGFARGEYRPGTLRGDAVLAHELAHVLQQRGATPGPAGLTTAGPPVDDAPLERDATRAAIAALARPGALRADLGEARERSLPPADLAAHAGALAALSPLPRRSSGLALRRCGGGKEEETSIAEAPAAFSPEELKGGATPAASAAPAEGAIALPVLGERGWKPLPDDGRLLMLRGVVGGQPRIVVVPARGYVHEPIFPPGAAPQQKGGPVIGAQAAGHASITLVRTGQGAGMLIDVGGAAPRQPLTVALATGLTALQQSFAITRIDAALITHTHADHVGGLKLLAEEGKLTGADVLVFPGWEKSPAKGPLGEAIAELAKGTTPGFAAGWKPTPISTTKVTGPTGQEYVTARFTIGTATLELATDAKKLEEFNRHLAAGDWKKASAVADPASMFTRVSSGPGLPEMIVVGDMRGRDIERLALAMGEPAFTALVGNSRIISGLHHLGAIETPADVRGLQILIKAVSKSGRQGFTIIAQVGAPFPVNQELVRAAQAAGGRVVFVEEAATGGKIQVSAGGKVEQVGGKEYGADPLMTQARSRLTQIEGALRVLEATPEYTGAAGVTRERGASGLKTEKERLEKLLSDRQDLATRDLHLDKADPKNADRLQDTSAKLTANGQALERIEGMEKTLGTAELERLSKAAASIGDYEKALARARAKGEAGEEVLKLVAQVDPSYAKQLLVDEMGKPMSRNQQRRAWRRVTVALRNQVAAQQALAAGIEAGRGRAAKAYAWFGLVQEAWNIAQPFVETALKEREGQKERNFYTFFRDLTWFGEKGVVPFFRGGRGDAAEVKDEEEMGRAVERRIYEDVPEARRKAMRFSGDVTKTAQLDWLYVPRLDDWPAEQRRNFFTQLLVWTSAHIHDVEDYAAEMEDYANPPIRIDPADVNHWQVRVGALVDGDVQVHWQRSPDLTTIMEATWTRMRAGTEAALEKRWKERPKEKPAPAAASAKAAEGPREGTALTAEPTAQSAVTARARLKSLPAMAYDQKHRGVEKLGTFQPSDEPKLFVLGFADAPSGYAWVIGADYPTYALLRRQERWRLVGREDIPRPPKTRDNEYLVQERPLEQYMSGDQIAAWKAHLAGARNVYFEERENDRVYRGTVFLYEKQPNFYGQVLVKTSDLVVEP